MRRLALAALASASAVALLWWHNVPTELTGADGNAIGTIIAGRHIAPRQADYQEQVRTIAAIQQAVLDAAPLYRSIPKGQTREPADLLRAGKGLCFDLSRTIEKTLQAFGFEVRHVSVYASIPDLLWPTDAPSHALSEVRTSRGWMLVDSIRPWLGIDAAGNPVSAARLSAGGADLPRHPSPAMAGKFVAVIGLYSRHGGFYPPYPPPYMPIPDVSWTQLLSGNF